MAKDDNSDDNMQLDREGLLDEYLMTREDYLSKGTNRPLKENDLTYLNHEDFDAIVDEFGSMDDFLAFAEQDYQQMFGEPTRISPAPKMSAFDSGPSDIMASMVPSTEGSMTVFDDEEEDPPGEKGEQLKEEIVKSGGIITDSGVMMSKDALTPAPTTELGLPFISHEDIEEIPQEEVLADVIPDGQTIRALPTTHDDLAPTGKTIRGLPIAKPEEIGIRRDTDTEMLNPKHMMSLGTLSTEDPKADPVEAWNSKHRDYKQESPVIVEPLHDQTENIGSPSFDGEISDAVDATFIGNSVEAPTPVDVSASKDVDYNSTDFIEPIHPGLDAEIDAEAMAMESPDSILPAEKDSIFDDCDPTYVPEATAPLTAESTGKEIRIDYAQNNSVDADGLKRSGSVEIDPSIPGAVTVKGIVTRDEVRDDLRDRGVSTSHMARDDEITDPETQIPRGYSQSNDIDAVIAETENDSVDERNWFQYLFSGDWIKGSAEYQSNEDTRRLDEQRAESLERKNTFTPWSTQAKRRAGASLGLILAGGLALGGGIAYLSSDDDFIDTNTNRGSPTHIVENSEHITIEHRLSKNMSVVLPVQHEGPDKISDDEDYESDTAAILDLTKKVASSRIRSSGADLKIRQGPVESDRPDVDAPIPSEQAPALSGTLDVTAYSPDNLDVDAVSPLRTDAQPTGDVVDTNCSFRAKMRFSSTAYSDRVGTLSTLETYVLAAFDAGHTEFTVYGMASIESQNDMLTVGHPVRDNDPINQYYATLRSEVGKRDIERILERNGISARVNTESWDEVELNNLRDSRGYVVMVNQTDTHPNDNSETRTAFEGVPIAETCGTCAPNTAYLTPDATPDGVIATDDSIDDSIPDSIHAQLPIDDGDDERTREIIREFFGTPATSDDADEISPKLGDDYDFGLDNSKGRKTGTDKYSPDLQKMSIEIHREYKLTRFAKNHPNALSREDFSSEFQTKYGYACDWDTAAEVYFQWAVEGSVDESMLASLLMPPSPDDITELGADDIMEIIDDYDEEIVIELDAPMDEADYAVSEALDMSAEYSPQRNALENLALMMGYDEDGKPVEGDEICYDAQTYMESSMALSNLSDMMARAETTEAEIDIDVDDFEDQTIYLSDDHSETDSVLAETVAMSAERPQTAHRLNEDGSLPEILNDHYDPIAAEESGSALARLADIMGYDADGNLTDDNEAAQQTLARLDQLIRQTDGYDIDGNKILPPVTREYDAIAGAESDAALERLTGILGYDANGREQDMDSIYAMEMRTLDKLDRLMEAHYAAEEQVQDAPEQSGVYFVKNLADVNEESVDENSVAVLGDVTDAELDTAFNRIISQDELEMLSDDDFDIVDLPTDEMRYVA